MALRSQSWGTDTCKCEFEVGWDDATDEDSRAHTFKKVFKQCPDHTEPDESQRYLDVSEENRRKNVGLGIMETLLSLDADQLAVLHGVWSFSGSVPRPMTVAAGKLLTSTEKDTAQTALDAQFGAGLVTVT